MLRFIHALSIPLLFLASCDRDERAAQGSPPQRTDPPSAIFKQEMDFHGKLLFVDTAKLGARVDRTSIELQFMDDSRVIMHSYAYNLTSHLGTYVLSPGQEVTLRFEELERQEKLTWPTMILSVENDRLVLTRKDGSRSLEGYWNLYPEAAGKLFPMKAKTKIAEQDGAQTPSAAADG